MRTIYKYQLRLVDEQIINMPQGAKIISAAMQNDYLCIWAEVDLETGREEERGIYICGTGNAMTDQPVRFINTVLAGPFVWHLYEIL